MARRAARVSDGDGAPPARIVSLVPSTTESVCVLGAAERLVGCTRYCTEPRAATARLPRVGGTKNPDLAAVLALAPDLVLCNAEENRAADIEFLQQRVPVLVQTPCSVVAAAQDLRELARRLAVAGGELEAILLRIEAELTAARVDGLEGRAPRVCYVIWRKPWMTVAAGTFVHDVLVTAGAQPLSLGGESRYPEFTPEQAVASGVELVLLASEPWEFDLRQREELRAAGTFGDAQVELCNGRDFSWHGVHMAEGLGRARALLRLAVR